MHLSRLKIYEIKVRPINILLLIEQFPTISQKCALQNFSFKNIYLVLILLNLL
jgi:hypothetical protein